MPVSPSPSVKRAATLLQILARDPRADLSLSELARRANINRASCQTLLLALTTSGLVFRKEVGPTYKLGTALIQLGEAAKASIDFVDLVQPELTVLRDRYGACGIAGSVSGEDIVLVATVSAFHPLGHRIAGSRAPLRAPFGAIYLAWADPSSIERWIHRSDASGTGRQKQRLAADLERIRNRGTSVTIQEGSASRFAVHELKDQEMDAEALNVAGISAPVWDSDGHLACSLALTAFPTYLSPAQISNIASAVKSAAERVTKQLRGESR